MSKVITRGNAGIRPPDFVLTPELQKQAWALTLVELEKREYDESDWEESVRFRFHTNLLVVAQAEREVTAGVAVLDEAGDRWSLSRSGGTSVDVFKG